MRVAASDSPSSDRDLGLGEPVDGHTDHQIRIRADDTDEIAVEQFGTGVTRQHFTVGRDFVGIGLTAQALVPVLALTRSDQVPLNVPQDGCRDPIDALQIQTPNGFRGPCKDFGCNLVPGADPAPYRSAPNGIQPRPERQQHQCQGTIGGRVVRLCGPDQCNQQPVFLVRHTATDVQRVQQSGGISEMRERFAAAPQSIEGVLKTKS